MPASRTRKRQQQVGAAAKARNNTGTAKPKVMTMEEIQDIKDRAFNSSVVGDDDPRTMEGSDYTDITDLPEVDDTDDPMEIEWRIISNQVAARGYDSLTDDQKSSYDAIRDIKGMEPAAVAIDKAAVDISGMTKAELRQAAKDSRAATSSRSTKAPGEVSKTTKEQGDPYNRTLGTYGKPLCLCGCQGEVTRVQAGFQMGHDAKLKSRVIKVSRGDLQFDDAIPEIALPHIGELSLRWVGIRMEPGFTFTKATK